MKNQDNHLNLQEKQPWQRALMEIVTDVDELFAILELDACYLKETLPNLQAFSLKVPRSYVARMQKGNFYDPLLRQVLPINRELDVLSGYTFDPLEERAANPVPGLLHKYHGRVLITLTGVCAIHCRYCFRRHFPYETNTPGRLGWEAMFAYISHDKSIQEVILSGGDPLAVNDIMLTQFITQLASIPHVKTLRIHTRLPIVIPERVTDHLIDSLTHTRLQVVLIVHANHAQELSLDVKMALLKMRNMGITLLNQAVLLKDVNDDVDTLVELSETLFSAQVLPYYIHLLDKVAGAAHFDINQKKALTLYNSLRKRLPGYLVPKFVHEEPGEAAKTPVT